MTKGMKSLLKKVRKGALTMEQPSSTASEGEVSRNNDVRA